MPLLFLQLEYPRQLELIIFARGYTPKGIETAVGEKIADQKEFWHHGPLIDETYDKNVPENLNISQVPEFNKHFDQHIIHITNF